MPFYLRRQKVTFPTTNGPTSQAPPTYSTQDNPYPSVWKQVPPERGQVVFSHVSCGQRVKIPPNWRGEPFLRMGGGRGTNVPTWPPLFYTYARPQDPGCPAPGPQYEPPSQYEGPQQTAPAPNGPSAPGNWLTIGIFMLPHFPPKFHQFFCSAFTDGFAPLCAQKFLLVIPSEIHLCAHGRLFSPNY